MRNLNNVQCDWFWEQRQFSDMNSSLQTNLRFAPSSLSNQTSRVNENFTFKPSQTFKENHFKPNQTFWAIQFLPSNSNSIVTYASIQPHKLSDFNLQTLCSQRFESGLQEVNWKCELVVASFLTYTIHMYVHIIYLGNNSHILLEMTFEIE